MPLVDDNGNKLGESKIAAQRGILAVVLSRIGMASPGMGESNYFFYVFLSSNQTLILVEMGCYIPQSYYKVILTLQKKKVYIFF